VSVDLTPAARRLADLVAGVPDGLLEAPTPCPEYRLGDLLDHVAGFTLAFTAAARKEGGEASGKGPRGDAAKLGSDWRQRIPRDLEALAAAWSEPSAWTGMTGIAGLVMPGQAVGLFALDELVIHGWDVARASGQPFECDPDSLGAVHELVAQVSGPGTEGQRQGLFGPEVTVPDDAPLLDRVLGMTGREPGWSPPAG
jgi:uncharacterized protein (TIGR03086 family)